MILLDMDGVLVNFKRGVAKALQVDENDPAYIVSNSVEEYFKMPKYDFWNKIHVEHPNFWIDLEPYEWTMSLFDLCNSLTDTYICTAPASGDANCGTGKIKWMNKYFGDKYNKFVLTDHKHLLADGHTILIDDSDKKIYNFTVAGGIGLVFPQPWNSNRDKNREEFIQEIKDYVCY